MLAVFDQQLAEHDVPDMPGEVSGVFFGDPARPGRLRDLLEARVDAVPAGGEISWVTYYFRDQRLADALVRAHRRGVRVLVSVEGAPRVRSANRAVIEKLSDTEYGIGEGLRVVKRGLFRHLHEKLYCFSHPQPAALVGSFNPSGNQPEDPRIVREIGDQDRGHNFLAEVTGAAVAPLIEHARALHSHTQSLFDHFPPRSNPIVTHKLRAYVFPRLNSPLDSLLRRLQSGSRLRIAASHLRDGGVAATLVMLAAAGVHVELLTEATERRVPPRIEQQLVASGVAFMRYRHPDELPMHNKFVLAESPEGRWSAFGSFNLTRTSRWLNSELLMVSEDDHVFDAFAGRWDAMKSEMAETIRSA
ncbi:phospholipase D-like domain-containing protein [Sphingomonas crusticola]|uniref:phospholipase D-like domain-containing protein n=1 Tax=Sphingomonas crusticola TaxID=1697973 RepID=UPI0019679F09|nr:phospholipase D-like domain-containing protein [Sphingomonas crusticola]